MANKIKRFMVVDTETATLPFVNEIAQNDANVKKKLAIAKPLIYDIGWTITNRKGDILETKQFLIAETFSVPSVFNTAYYKEKRPIYIEMLKRGETTIRTWKEVIDIFIDDMAKVDSVGAFNSMFDFKKAIPFTDLYINMLYSDNYYEWEKMQRKSCERIAREPASKEHNPDFDPEHFLFHGKEYDLFDLWGLAATHLLNNSSYKRECLEHGLMTNSGTFFKTSAESSYQYLCNKYDFVESHTALDDAKIETFILSKIAQKHAITNGIKYFPFRDLGYTSDFAMRRKYPNLKECQTVYDAMAAYVDSLEELTNYARSVLNKMETLAKYAGFTHNYE